MGLTYSTFSLNENSLLDFKYSMVKILVMLNTQFSTKLKINFVSTSRVISLRSFVKLLVL